MKKTTVYVKEGKITNPKVVKNAFELPDGRYEMTLKRLNKRSLQSNAYYWACVVEYEQEGFKNIGYDWSKEQVHEFNKAEFNYIEVVNPQTGEIKRAPSTTTDLSNHEFSQVFIERIKLFSAEWLNTYIPEPATQTVFSYE